MRRAGRHRCRDKIDMLPQLLWIRPRNAQALPAKSVDEKVCAIGAEVCLGTSFSVNGQLSASENVWQTKLLADRGAKAAAGKAPQFQKGRFPNLAFNASASFYSQRAA